jgi:hypothetical protein
MHAIIITHLARAEIALLIVVLFELVTDVTETYCMTPV